MAPRSAEQRKADALRLLDTEADVWVATADGGEPALVPLSLCWDGEVVTMTTAAAAPTARNATSSRRARLAVGSTRDVVMIDGEVEVLPVADAPDSVAAAFVERTGWNPADDDGEWVYLRIRPRRIQAWREADEIDGRTIMRDGSWLV